MLQRGICLAFGCPQPAKAAAAQVLQGAAAVAASPPAASPAISGAPGPPAWRFCTLLCRRRCCCGKWRLQLGQQQEGRRRTQRHLAEGQEGAALHLLLRLRSGCERAAESRRVWCQQRQLQQAHAHSRYNQCGAWLMPQPARQVSQAPYAVVGGGTRRRSENRSACSPLPAHGGPRRCAGARCCAAARGCCTCRQWCGRAARGKQGGRGVGAWGRAAQAQGPDRAMQRQLGERQPHLHRKRRQRKIRQHRKRADERCQQEGKASQACERKRSSQAPNHQLCGQQGWDVQPAMHMQAGCAYPA